MAVSVQIFPLCSYTRMRKRLFAYYLLGVTLYFTLFLLCIPNDNFDLTFSHLKYYFSLKLSSI